MTTVQQTNTSPDTLEIALGELRVASFPSECAWDMLRVHFADDVYGAILKHAQESKDIELCGVLVGEVLKDERGPFVSITHSIRGEKAEHHAAQVTFTQDTWAHIHRVMDSAHAARTIVGWYHTHPGFGIFLSEMDVFIHRHFFNLPWQVAFVVDPIAGDEGLFVWRAGSPACTRVYWVGQVEKVSVPVLGHDGVLERVATLERCVIRARRSIARHRAGLLALFVFVLGLGAVVAAGFIWPEECERFARDAWARLQQLVVQRQGAFDGR